MTDRKMSSSTINYKAITGAIRETSKIQKIYITKGGTIQRIMFGIFEKQNMV